MSVKPVTMYTVVCDECGRDAFEGGEYVAWSEQDQALEMARELVESGEWSEHGGKHRCEDHNPFCTRCGRDAGELCGERDYMCPPCWIEMEGAGA